ncbi:MAG: hypothetical protein ACYTBV_18035, partial [Planctomycetota bacterium]
HKKSKGINLSLCSAAVVIFGAYIFLRLKRGEKPSEKVSPTMREFFFLDEEFAEVLEGTSCPDE